MEVVQLMQHEYIGIKSKHLFEELREKLSGSLSDLRSISDAELFELIDELIDKEDSKHYLPLKEKISH